MSQFPTYYQPQMNIQNPYQSFSQPVQNPYMAQMGQYQQNFQPQLQQAQQQQPTGLNCRIVDDFNSIVANDVPMDGNGAFFVKRDGSEVQHRNWAANGTIVTTPYKPVQPENQSEGTNMPQIDFNTLNEDVRALREDIMARLDSIEKYMGGTTPKTTSRAKKGADEE